MRRTWRDPRTPLPSLRGWDAYRAAQRGRRIHRRAARTDELVDALPPGVTVTPLTHGATTLRLEGYGIVIVWDPTHNNAWMPGEQAPRVMTPIEVVREFRWRWKREGCPSQTTHASPGGRS
jgi:hypothetical protein